MNGWARLVVALMLLAGVPVRAQSLTFDATTVGGPGSGAQNELFMPIGVASTAAVVVLHGCSGVEPHDRIWATQLAQWGYAALLVDSFRPRGFTEVCNRGRLVPAEAQARDAFDAAAYLRSRPDIPALHVGVIGFSHGGWAVLKAMLANVVRQPAEPPFTAAVAFYPGCDPPGSPIETDTLILIGDSEDWTPLARCKRWRDQVQTNGHTLQMKVYPGARHAFDAQAMPHYFAGHYIGQEPAAAGDALAETRAFFSACLGARP
jgi:dienelactone hydrolase